MRCIGAFLSDSGTIPIKNEGNWDQYNSNTAQQSGSPLDTHAVEHLSRK